MTRKSHVTSAAIRRVLGWPIAMTVSVFVVASASGCSSHSPTGASSSGGIIDTSPLASSASASANGLGAGHQLVVLGDSIATDNFCPGCRTFGDLYGAWVSHVTGKPVHVVNLAVPDTNVSDLLAQVRHDPDTRNALSGTDTVVITIGFNDTPWNRVEDPCHAAPDYPVIQWRRITPSCTTRVTASYERALDQVVTLIEKLRAGRPLMLRATTVYNNVIGDHNDPGWDSPTAVDPSVLGNAALTSAQCAVLRQHGGACARMGPLMNGTDGRGNADPYLAEHTHMNQRGHALTAKALTLLGIDFTSH